MRGGYETLQKFQQSQSIGVDEVTSLKAIDQTSFTWITTFER